MRNFISGFGATLSLLILLVVCINDPFRRLNEIERRLDSLEVEKAALEKADLTPLEKRYSNAVRVNLQLMNENKLMWQILEKAGRPKGDQDLTECQ